MLEYAPTLRGIIICWALEHDRKIDDKKIAREYNIPRKLIKKEIQNILKEGTNDPCIHTG